jgi:hypothetical protein
MKIYRGRRTAEGCVVTVRRNGEPPQPLDPRLDLCNHSPTGFEWGYGGSGPAQLALAILADVLGDDDRALALHHDFKWDYLAGIADDEFCLYGQTIDEWSRRPRRLA